MPRLPFLAFVSKEFEEMVPSTIFFAVGFSLILLTTNLILEDYGVRFSSYLLAMTGALIVGKAVLVANGLPFFRRLDTAPLIRPVLFKSLLYFAAVGVLRFLEELIEFLKHGGALREVPDYVATHFTWNRFFAIQIWILILFLIYTFTNELNTLFGGGELARILFIWRPTELKQTRRQRIRTLTKLSRLADAHTTEELADPATVAHTQMIGLIRSLAKNGASRASPIPMQR
jgi:hypothetical protein